MWMGRLQAIRQLQSSQREARLRQTQNQIASAAIDARRGDYEPARQAISNFFTQLGAETNQSEDSIFTAEQRERLKPLLLQRDEVITLLARSDPAAADRLTDLYVVYRRESNSALPPAPVSSQ